jgi:hypothetical protein
MISDYSDSSDNVIVDMTKKKLAISPMSCLLSSHFKDYYVVDLMIRSSKFN